MKKIDILGIPFDNLTKKQFVTEIMNNSDANKKTFIVTANPEIVMYAKENTSYSCLLHEADYITADGIGVIKASHMLNTPIIERVAGFDLMISLLEEANKKNKRVYFLGAKKEVVKLATENVATNYPNIIICGFHDGYFGANDSTIMESVQASNPDFIFVALGFPRQEEWIHTYLKTASKGSLMGVGGSFDVLSGKVKRAPKIFQNLHLEWLYRLLKQPTRFVRMLVLPKFLLEVKKVIKEKKVK